MPRTVLSHENPFASIANFPWRGIGEHCCDGCVHVIGSYSWMSGSIISLPRSVWILLGKSSSPKYCLAVHMSIEKYSNNSTKMTSLADGLGKLVDILRFWFSIVAILYLTYWILYIFWKPWAVFLVAKKQLGVSWRSLGVDFARLCHLAQSIIENSKTSRGVFAYISI